MKKIILSLVIGLGSLAIAPAMAQTPVFSASEMANVKVRDLTFKEVMRQFYRGQMIQAYANGMEDMPYIGLGQYSDNGDISIATMHPVLQYKNTVGADRYLVIIEILQVSEGEIVSCHACHATADLYSFKKLNTGMFQLVSRTPKDVNFSSKYGRVNLNINDIEQGIQPLGKNLIGSVFMNSDMSTGVKDSWWEVLHLPEDDFINKYYAGDGGSTTKPYDEDSPLSYDYEGSLQVMQDNTAYYPIMLTYTGEMPMNDYEYVEHVNYSKIAKFNPMKKVYK